MVFDDSGRAAALAHAGRSHMGKALLHRRAMREVGTRDELRTERLSSAFNQLNFTRLAAIHEDQNAEFLAERGKYC